LPGLLWSQRFSPLLTPVMAPCHPFPHRPPHISHRMFLGRSDSQMYLRGCEKMPGDAVFTPPVEEEGISLIVSNH
jgi:hypothetical protein